MYNNNYVCSSIFKQGVRLFKALLLLYSFSLLSFLSLFVSPVFSTSVPYYFVMREYLNLTLAVAISNLASC